MIKRLIYVALLVFAVSCFKDTEYNTRMILTPEEQLTSGGDYIALEGVVAYAFEQSDTTEWSIMSYEDALAGLLTSKLSGEIASPIATAISYEGDSEGMLEMQVEGESVLLLAVDTKNMIYGVRLYDVGINLPTTRIYLPFYPWNTGSYTSGSWSYVAPEDETTDDETLDDE